MVMSHGDSNEMLTPRRLAHLSIRRIEGKYRDDGGEDCIVPFSLVNTMPGVVPRTYVTAMLYHARQGVEIASPEIHVSGKSGMIEYEQIRARAPWSQFVEALDEMLDKSIIRCTAPVLVALLMSATASRDGGGWNPAPEASAKEAGSKKLSLLEFGPVYKQMQVAATKGAQGKEVAEEHCAVGSWAQGQM